MKAINNTAEKEAGNSRLDAMALKINILLILSVANFLMLVFLALAVAMGGT